LHPGHRSRSTFPVDLSPEVVLVLATALATRISWAEPFDMVPAAVLGPDSPWARTLSRVLRTPQEGWGHDQFIAATGEAGDVVAQPPAQWRPRPQPRRSRAAAGCRGR
jgi:hypothetical protein